MAVIHCEIPVVAGLNQLNKEALDKLEPLFGKITHCDINFGPLNGGFRVHILMRGKTDIDDVFWGQYLVTHVNLHHQCSFHVEVTHRHGESILVFQKTVPDK
jgi:hypothetical protein